MIFTKEQLKEMTDKENPSVWCRPEFAAFALGLLNRAEAAEAIIESWGCPKEKRVCLNCGRETPCMNEDDLEPEDPGVPCTFDRTFPQMVELLKESGSEINMWSWRAMKAEEDADQLRVQLAGCGVAALGGTSEAVIVKQGDYGWSPSYQDVLNLRIKYDRMCNGE